MTMLAQKVPKVGTERLWPGRRTVPGEGVQDQSGTDAGC